jgi:hypothetical protein
VHVLQIMPTQLPTTAFDGVICRVYAEDGGITFCCLESALQAGRKWEVRKAQMWDLQSD